MMEMRGGSRRVEKMGNTAMNCLAQGNNWKVCVGRGRRFTLQGVDRGNNFLSPSWTTLHQASYPRVPPRTRHTRSSK
jgi:hypothetical protein